jgi:hypothetical protein
VTDKQGYYDPSQISVKGITVDGTIRRVMDCELRPAWMNANTTFGGITKKRPSGCAPEPRGIITKGEIVEVCFRTTDNNPGYHMANLGWRLNNSDWPEFGEPDDGALGRTTAARFADACVMGHLHHD